MKMKMTRLPPFANATSVFDPPIVRRVAQKLDFGEDLSLPHTNKENMMMILPNIQASLSETPGKRSRSVLGKRSNVKLHIGQSSADRIDKINANMYVLINEKMEK